jgi:dynein heavy chain
MTILHKFYNPKILEEGYKFSSSGKYFAPPSGSFSDYRKYLDALPNQDSPEIFGMHANANITYMMQETSAIFGTILALQPRDAGGEGAQSPDEIVIGIAQSIQKGLPAILDRDKAGSTTFKMRDNGQMDSLATVLGQEMVKFNRLLHRLSTSLVGLQKAIKGLVVMSLDLDKMYTSFQRNQVPQIWEKVGFASLKPLASWVSDMQGRFEFLRAWLMNGQPAAFSLPVFFFPQGFLTGALQNHSRKYGIPINALDFRFEVQTESVDELEGPEDGVIVYGMFMEGARYNRDHEMLVDSIPAEMYSEMPSIHFVPQENYASSSETYSCPCYKTSLRQGVLSTTGISTNFVIAVDLPCERDPEDLVLQGAACLLNLND